MREAWRLVLLASQSTSTVLVTGETGVGKEVAARTLHRFSARRSRPFVAVNCAALPETLLESELFGHEKGAFTGAAARHTGRFELADGGTLFLDEIGDLPLPLQVKLLRVLQERTFERVGGREPVAVDVRVIAATHRDLDEEVRRGRFRADLYYRLDVVTIHVPPLRDRKADVLDLWARFLDEAATRDGIPPLSTSGAVRRLLLAHSFPGNVRELHNAAQHALAIARASRILPADLPAGLTGRAAHTPERTNLVGLTLKDVERAAILETYEAVGTVRAAAEMLGISQRKIHYRLREYRRTGADATHGSVASAVAERAVADGPLRARVLLAEDDDDLRWALAECIRSEGYEVLAVADGRGVLERLGAAMLLERRELPVDVIVTDLRMPGLTGMQLLESVRNGRYRIPVVVITAFADDQTRHEAEALGAAAFLEKPVDVAALQRALRQAVC
jgi:DNA-binding NtrC family response regulator